MRTSEAQKRGEAPLPSSSASRTPSGIGLHRSGFGKFVLLRKLASGGMGEVFLAKQRDRGEQDHLVVIKRILSHHLDKRDYVDMFFSEARLVARLRHPNIVSIHEMGEIDGDYYIAMEYVEGKTMREMVDLIRTQRSAVPIGHAVELGIKLCEGLAYAHSARDDEGRPINIVHRDINPHNVLLSYEGDLKIIDFGIAKSELTLVHTATGTIKGKFIYMSPEQSAAEPLDRRSDIFSIGIVLHELLSLDNPFVRQNVVLSLEAIQRQPVPPVSARRPDAAPIDAVLDKALQKDPKDRFQSATELRDALLGLLTSGAIATPSSDFGSYMKQLFAREIAKEASLLEEAENKARRMATPIPAFLASEDTDEHGQADESPSARVVPVEQRLGFSDEEPTVSGNHETYAERSRAPTNAGVRFDRSPIPASGVRFDRSPPSVSGVRFNRTPVSPPLRRLTARPRTNGLVELTKYAFLFLATMAIAFLATRLVVDRTIERPVPLLRSGAADETELEVEPTTTPVEAVQPKEISKAEAKLIKKALTKTDPSFSATRSRRPRPAQRKIALPERGTHTVDRVKHTDTEEAPSQAETGPAMPSLGRLSIRTSAGLTVVVDEAVPSSSGFELAKRQGLIELSGGEGVEYAITLWYSVVEDNLEVTLDSTPWAIVRRDGLSLGRTPQGPVRGRSHRFSLTRPGQATPVVVQLSFRGIE